MTEISVLDHGFVKLISHHGDDALIVRAARTSYGDGTKSVREDAALIDYLVRHQHTSPLELVNFTFHLKMPIFVARQWQRHRTARLNEISGRYSVMKDEFYIPDKWREQDTVNKQGSVEPEAPDEDKEARHTNLLTVNDDHAYACYQILLDNGVAREMARTVLPLNLYTEMYWQMDLHNLLHFLKLRLDAHAQLEIQRYAAAILQLIRPLVPVTVAAWENHVQKAVRFSADEMGVLCTVLSQHPDLYEPLENIAKHRGMKTTRVREFLDKFGELA